MDYAECTSKVSSLPFRLVVFPFLLEICPFFLVLRNLRLWIQINTQKCVPLGATDPWTEGAQNKR